MYAAGEKRGKSGAQLLRRHNLKSIEKVHL